MSKTYAHLKEEMFGEILLIILAKNIIKLYGMHKLQQECQHLWKVGHGAKFGVAFQLR